MSSDKYTDTLIDTLQYTVYNLNPANNTRNSPQTDGEYMYQQKQNRYDVVQCTWSVT